MTDTKRIQATLGPYRGQNLDVPADVADQAIADGWAVDPFAPPLTDEETEKVRAMQSEDKTTKAAEAAEAAAKKLRGEDEAQGKARKNRTREMEPEAGKPYTTREAKYAPQWRRVIFSAAPWRW
jgi:hypothetical protein